MIEVVAREFRQRFGEAPRFVARAPGRVNLIGEHTDYNDGFVLPMAIDRATWIALRPRDDDHVVMHGLDHNETLQFSLAELNKRAGHWGEYPKAVAWALQDAGYELCGFDSVMACDVPMGAGLSSSASFEVAVARALVEISGNVWEPVTMAKLCRRAENEWVGVNCGIMDQMISACGKAGHALLIDCRSLATRPVALPAGCVVAVLDTATRRGLMNSDYNQRRSQCEAAARFFGVKALRDVSRQEFDAREANLDELTRRRARHVITENERTLAAAATRDAAEFGRLMNASHKSLRDDFEVSSRELDWIVQCAQSAPGCYGARMTGAGFGGCAAALVRADARRDFDGAVVAGYQKATGLTARVYVCEAANGAELIDAARGF
jgi:galactokinase